MEFANINKLKNLLKSKQVELDYSYFNDFFLLKFLRARNHDLQKTYDMIIKYFKWFFNYGGYD